MKSKNDLNATLLTIVMIVLFCLTLKSCVGDTKPRKSTPPQETVRIKVRDTYIDFPKVR